MTSLNTHDGWEMIVNTHAVVKQNARQRVAARKKQRKLAKNLAVVCGLAAGGILAILLGLLGAAAAWLATVVAVLCCCSSCYAFGKYREGAASGSF